MGTENKNNIKNVRQEALSSFGRRMRALRKKKEYYKGIKFSQEKLGEMSGLHRNYISDVERGTRNISFVAMVKIIKALDCSIPEFFAEGFDKVNLDILIDNANENTNQDEIIG